MHPDFPTGAPLVLLTEDAAHDPDLVAKIKAQLIAGKWLGAWSSTALAVLCFYAAVAAVVCLKGGTFQWGALAQTYALQMAMLAVIQSMTVALSTRLNADAAATLSYVLSAGAFVVLPKAGALLAPAAGAGGAALTAAYYLAPHLELFDMRRRVVHDFGPTPWPAFSAVLLYGAVWTALFIILAWLGYRRRRFSRTAME